MQMMAQPASSLPGQSALHLSPDRPNDRALPPSARHPPVTARNCYPCPPNRRLGARRGRSTYDLASTRDEAVAASSIRPPSPAQPEENCESAWGHGRRQASQSIDFAMTRGVLHRRLFTTQPDRHIPGCGDRGAPFRTFAVCWQTVGGRHPAASDAYSSWAQLLAGTDPHSVFQSTSFAAFRIIV